MNNQSHGRIYDVCEVAPFWYYFPSLMVNCPGDMVMGFSGSSATNFIGAYYTWRLADGSILEEPRLIRAGLTNYPGTGSVRWGDYSATTVDPADDWSFWTVQEYADPAGGDSVGQFPWKTVIAEIRPNP